MIDSKLDYISQKILMCNKCELYKLKTNYIVGHWPKNNKAKLAFVHGYPGVQEDLTGKVLVGKHGKKFKTNVHKHLGLTDQDFAYLTCVKCIPLYPGFTEAKEPKRKSLFWCAEYLFEQLETLGVDIIVPLGYISIFVFIKRKDLSFKGYNDDN